ncbi:glycosyl transferase, group 2 family [Flavobacterium limnosediminis JC2902]|uniref:Glycosyl transferase, group 2 family n=1 Tax=Flavobacterium limnosediminis JC2902 TaxID=1341181 RepID=V6SGW5_9FLAO|nr:glycosyltransferase [Flavobacterium limnosediminis]ESU25953.1 glycosyl transferase, group 2 family [Flavobacterium limnosediminis JC2902]
MDINPMISFAIPVYKAEKILDTLIDEIDKVMMEISMTYEVIMVDDGSPDNSWEIMKRISEKRPHVQSMKLSRNFEQHPTSRQGFFRFQVSGLWYWIAICRTNPRKLLNNTIRLWKAMMWFWPTERTDRMVF